MDVGGCGREGSQRKEHGARWDAQVGAGER